MTEYNDENGMFEKQVLTDELAEQEFARMLRAARVKWHVYETVHGKRDVEADKAIVVDAIMYGQIELNDEGFPTINTLHENEKLKRVVMRGRSSAVNWLSMDRIPEGQEIKKLYSVIGKAFGLTAAELGALEDADLNVIKAVWSIFLG